MNVSLLQVQSAPPTPTTDGAPADPPAGSTHFTNFLDKAMKKNSPSRQTELLQAPENQGRGKPQSHRKSSQAATNLQTPAIIASAAYSSGNIRAALAQGQSSGDGHAPSGPAQKSANREEMLGNLTARQFQPGVEGTQHTPETALGLTNQLITPQMSNQKDPVQGDLQAGAKVLTQNPSFFSARAPEEASASAKAQALPYPESTSVRTHGTVLKAISPIIQDSTGLGVLTTGTQGKPLQRGLAAMEDLQLNLFSRTTAENAALLPGGLQAATALSADGVAGRAAAGSAGTFQPKQQTAAHQNPAKDAGGANVGTGIPLNTTTSGSSADSPKDGETGQNFSSRHPEISGSKNSGASTASGSFNSVATSATVTSANVLSAVASQTTAANVAPANTASLLQPGTSHAAADKMAATLENPINPVGGLVNSASLLQMQGKTEMRVAMHTESLGPLELHAVLDGGQLGASIAVVNQEAHTLLTNNLPALQQVLNEQNVRVDHLSVLNAPTSSGTNTGSGGGFHSGGNAQSRPNVSRWAFSRPVPVSLGDKNSTVIESLRGRLSVRA